MKLGIAQFYPAASSNYSRGRQQPIRYVTIHHSAGWEQTLRYLWGDPNRNGSSHFWVGNTPNHIEQYVDTVDTAWCNGNWRSNNESISIEVRGDWRGYYDQATLDNLQKLVTELRRNYPSVGIEYHQDVSDKMTLCPADLKHKGWARQVWDKVTGALNPPTPTPTPSAITYRAISPKRVELIVATNLWDFNFTTWAGAKAVKPYGQGSVIDVVAIAKNALGAEYYMTAYSYDEGRIRATQGFNIKDAKDYVSVITQPPTVELKWEPMLTPRKMRLLTESKVTDLDKMTEFGDTVSVGTDIDLVELKTVSAGVVYARSKYSMTTNKNWGIRLDRFGEVPETPLPPAPPTEPVPEPPLDTNPTTPGNGDVITQLGIIRKILTAIAKFFGIKWE